MSDFLVRPQSLLFRLSPSHIISMETQTREKIERPPDQVEMIFVFVFLGQKLMKRLCVPVQHTLALIMVGLGSKIPCIFLKAGITKRLQVTTADTGFPRTVAQREEESPEKDRDRERDKRQRTTYEQRLFSRSSINLSNSQLHTLPGSAKISLRAPSMSRVANVVGRLLKKKKIN